MTGEELIEEIREHLDEPGKTVKGDNYYTDARLLSLINRSYRKIIRKTGCLWKQTNYTNSIGVIVNPVASTAGTNLHILPDDFMEVSRKLGVWWNEGFGYPLTGRDKIEMGRDTGEWGGVQGSSSPIIYEILSTNLDHEADTGSKFACNLYPAPPDDGNLLHLYYVCYPGDITNSTEPLFDEQWQELIIFFVARYMKLKREKMDSYRVLDAHYRELLRDMINYYDRKATDTRRQVPKTGNINNNSAVGQFNIVKGP